LPRPEEPEEEEKVAEHKVTFVDTLKGMEAARKYIHHFGTKNNIIVMCSKVGTELYRELKGKRKDWLKK
jgi:hypothetical protein